MLCLCPFCLIFAFYIFSLHCLARIDKLDTPLRYYGL